MPARKSAKRTARKKRSGTAKRGTKRGRARKSAARKGASRRAASQRGTAAKRTKRKAGLKRQAEKGLRAARDGIETVRQVGDRAWETLKSTTSQVVEGVRETLNREEQEPRQGYPYR